MHAQYIEHTAARNQSVGIAGLAAVGQVERRLSPRERAGKCPLVVPNLLPDAVGNLTIPVHASATSVRIGELHFREFMRGLDRERTQADRIEQLENGSVGADAER